MLLRNAFSVINNNDNIKLLISNVLTNNLTKLKNDIHRKHCSEESSLYDLSQYLGRKIYSSSVFICIAYNRSRNIVSVPSIRSTILLYYNYMCAYLHYMLQLHFAHNSTSITIQCNLISD